MDSDAVIGVAGLGKRYTLGARSGERYTALRDVIAQSARGWFRRTPRSETGEESFWALRDVSFEVAPGEVLGIIGRNGAGKSTLLKLLSRITEPTTGTIRYRGRVASLLEVGTGFHPELTGRENIFLNGAILGMSRVDIKAKFDEIVAFSEVEKFLDTPVKRYSSGMYVRLAFAVAAHLEPEILVVDEVLAVGDAQFQKKCLGKMRDVAAGEGRTVLFVSHNMAAMQALCTRAIYLKSGRIAGGGAVDQTIAKYLDESRTSANSQPGSTRMLDVNLELRAFNFTPNPVQTGGEVAFHLEITAQTSTRLLESAILIYSHAGSRVAILDLRSIGQPNLTANAAPLVIRGRIFNLPLVEGTYYVGLYIKTDASMSNFEELLTLDVSGPQSEAGFVPFPPESRGIVELPFTLVL